MEADPIIAIAAERLATIGGMSQRIARELRNSLTVVGGLARRLHEKTRGNDNDKKFLKMIFDEVKILEEKVANLIRLGAEE